MSNFKTVRRWHFDNYRRGPSYVAYEECDELDESRIVVYVEGEPQLSIGLYPDQWGTYISLDMGLEGHVIAQEAGTRSFLGALFAALESQRSWIDVNTKPPTVEEIT